MSQQASIPVPIDRPLSKGYLREFSGWSTAYPPGLSEPSSLREMHNVLIDADGSLRIRPGLRHALSEPAPGDIVGAFEHFYTADGDRALLFAYRTPYDDTVRFRTAVYDEGLGLFVQDASIGTRFPGASAAGLALSPSTTFVKYVQIDNRILALNNGGDPFRIFYVGTEPRALIPQEITAPTRGSGSRPEIVVPHLDWVEGTTQASTLPAARTATEDTLQSTDASKNQVYNVFFYTFSNEIGESLSSNARFFSIQRGWNQWVQHATDDAKSEDQLVAIVPAAEYATAGGQGATHWNLYWGQWTIQGVRPDEAMLVRSVEMRNAAGALLPHDTAGKTAVTPGTMGTDMLHSLPSDNDVDNFTIPSKAANGLVAGDRLVLVHDSDNAARIRWSSNQQGDYLNFSSSRGGGVKTLTSGNLMLPASVVLWQNPQSVDTITILCQGLDGEGTSYYMNANSQINNNTQLITIMGFEETNATPGTVAPYAVEVLKNALYHPQDNNLMKTTAANYNISHSMVADPIQNVWHRIPARDKRRMVSSQMDSSLYYLVRSPLGWETPEDTDNGNQIWVSDTEQSGAWSVFDVRGTALRKLELDGLLYMGVTSGAMIYVLDPEYVSDDVWVDGRWETRGIAWSACTNTMGANKSHDQWVHLQQVNVTFGSFTGECVYGIRGKDVHGHPVEVKKHFKGVATERDPLVRFDHADFLLVERGMAEWEFFWESAERPRDRSYGSIAFVQFTFTPLTRNVHWEHGSVDTGEYRIGSAPYSNGVAKPFADTRLR